MNKRIKRKIGKRILKNIAYRRPLSEFDKKFASASIKPIIERLDQYVEANEVKKVSVYAENQLVESYYKEEKNPDYEAISTMPIQVRDNTEASPSEWSDAYDSLKYAVLMNDKPIIVRHPSKWQKIKSKVKGWFGK